MIDRIDVEYALLLSVVENKNFEILLKNDITEDYFSNTGKLIYHHIEDYLNKYSEYMHVNNILKEFDIDLDYYSSLKLLGNTQFFMDTLKQQHASDVIVDKLSALNASSGLIHTQPVEFLKSFDATNDSLKQLLVERKSVNLLDNLDKILQLDRNNVIKTGFKELDDKLIGWNKGEELIILMGRPGQGKSFLGLKFSLAVAIQKYRVGIYSGEMSEEQVQKRLIMLNKQGRTMTDAESISDMRAKDLKLTLLTQKELQGRATVKDLESMILKDELDFLFVDQLSLMDDYHSRVYDTRTRFANISADLFSLSIKYSIPIVLAVQSNRDGGLQKDAPQLENIAESDVVGQNATRVIGMRREANITTMNISKNRYGDDKFMQKYDTDFELGKFTPIMTAESPLAQAQVQSQARKRTLGSRYF